MLEITIKDDEMWDSVKEEFVYPEPFTLRLEHSLLSISKWESKWKKPFLDDATPKTYEESLDYVRCMTINPGAVPSDVYSRINSETMNRITEYIKDKQTATWFSASEKRRSRFSGKKITSELIYYWMAQLNLPFDKCEKWHISRLITLIEVCNIENGPPEMMSKGAIHRQNKDINAARRKKYHTKG